MKIKDILEGGKRSKNGNQKLLTGQDSFKQFLEKQELPSLDNVYVSTDGIEFQRLDEERKWVSGRFTRNIGIDQPTYGAGQEHAHVYGRRGTEIVAVNVDGTASHGTKGTLHKNDADALRLKGFDIPGNGIIEWEVVGEVSDLLLG